MFSLYGVVHKKFKSSLIEKNASPAPVEQTPRQTYTHHGRSLREPAQQMLVKDESRDSGQESDTAQPSAPRISNAKLAKIKHLAKAKLRQTPLRGPTQPINGQQPVA